LEKGILHHIAASTESEKFARLPRCDEMKFSPDASTSTSAPTTPSKAPSGQPFRKTGNVPLVADMSSDIAARPIDVKKVRRHLRRRPEKSWPLRRHGGHGPQGPGGTRRQESSHASAVPHAYQGEVALSHAPTFAVYIVGLVLEWIESEGGIPGIEKRNGAKARLLYDTIESSGAFYSCPVEKASRSKMNVVFRVAGGDDSIERKFATEAAAARLVGTPGHRSVGGCACRSTTLLP